MLNRLNPILKVVCLVLAALIVYQLAAILTRKDRLADFHPDTLLVPAAASAATTAPTNKATNANVRVANKQPDLPPAVQARVDRITQSEILAAVIRPLPMALLGIAGKDAFIRTPTGQSALLREGEEVGGVKLLKIGTNRVLIEHEQQKKELTVFAGFGSESMLPKGEKPSSETHTR